MAALKQKQNAPENPEAFLVEGFTFQLLQSGMPLIPQAAAAIALFFGRPPRRPFFFAAARLAALHDLPPSAPRRAAIQFREPRKPISKPGK